MPVQPVISLEQIVIIVAFLMVLIALMWFLRRHRGGITSRIHADRRMQHIEDLSLAPQQRLHLIEVDGRTFLVHAGKGHAASFIAVGGDTAGPDTAGADTAAPAAKSASKSAAPRGQSKSSTKKPAPVVKPKSGFAAAIAQARRNNPSLEFGK
jgi:flagellar biogenesis protein FliO